MDDDINDDLRRILDRRDPLACLDDALKLTGAWRGWPIARQMRYLRHRREMTQDCLSLLTFVSQSRISRIEAGADFKWSTLELLWGALEYRPLVLPVPITDPGTSDMPPPTYRGTA